MANQPDEAWPEQDARLLTMLSTSGRALTLGEFLLRCEIDSVALAETVRGSMGRLVGAGLARWSDGRFFVTSEGRAVAPGGTGRYFKDLFKETAEALSGHAMEAEADLGLTAEDFDAAVAYVADYKDRRRTRRGYSGYDKWAEWHDAPPLTFGECLEFLTFSEGREVDVGVESVSGMSGFAGTLGLIVVLWRAGLRIGEALALTEPDLDQARGSVLVRHGKGGKRREVGMDAWAWEQLQPWLQMRVQLPVGPLFCVINAPTQGRPCAAGAVRQQLRHAAHQASVRRRFAPHQLRHAHAVEMAREGVPLNVIQRQLGHTNLGVTSIYLQGIDNTEIIATVTARRAPVLSASSVLRL